MKLQRRFYNGRPLWTRGDKINGYLHCVESITRPCDSDFEQLEPVNIAPAVWRELPKAGRPKMDPNEKLIRKPVSMPPELWKLVEGAGGLNRLLIQRAVADYFGIKDFIPK
jgi:hypothetical protein